MAWNDSVSNDIAMIVSEWTCFILTLSISALILLDNNITLRISIIMVLNSCLNKCWVVQLLVDLKIQSLVLLITFSLVDLVADAVRSFLLFEGFLR